MPISPPSDQLTPETVWRRFRRESPGAELLAVTQAQRESIWRYLRAEGMTRTALEQARQDVPWPLALTWNLEDMARRDGVLQDGVQGLLAASCSAWLTWRDTGKRVYRLTPELAAGLVHAKWPAGYPAAQFRPPVSCVWLELPRYDGTTQWVAWLLDLHTDLEASGAYELRLVELRANGILLPLVILDLTTATLDDAIAAALDRARRNAAAERTLKAGEWEMVDDIAAERWTGQNATVRLATNALLYLLGDEDVVAAVHPGAKPDRPAGVRTPASEADRRAHDLADPAVYHVGRSYSAAIERWADDREAEAHGEEAEASGRTVRPHLRAAHAHLYWTGPGRTIAKVRFLPPIRVRGGITPGDDAPPDARRVR